MKKKQLAKQLQYLQAQMHQLTIHVMNLEMGLTPPVEEGEEDDEEEEDPQASRWDELKQALDLGLIHFDQVRRICTCDTCTGKRNKQNKEAN